jgi:hypothetical protein
MSTRTKKTSQPELNPIQPRPDKKSKFSDPTKNSIPNLELKTQTHGESGEMEAQGEKKRRREEEVSTSNTDVSEHFLTASPGSQHCWDQ